MISRLVGSFESSTVSLKKLLQKIYEKMEILEAEHSVALLEFREGGLVPIGVL